MQKTALVFALSLFSACNSEPPAPSTPPTSSDSQPHSRPHVPQEPAATPHESPRRTPDERLQLKLLDLEADNALTWDTRAFEQRIATLPNVKGPLPIELLEDVKSRVRSVLWGRFRREMREMEVEIMAQGGFLKDRLAENEGQPFRTDLEHQLKKLQINLDQVWLATTTAPYAVDCPRGLEPITLYFKSRIGNTPIEVQGDIPVRATTSIRCLTREIILGTRYLVTWERSDPWNPSEEQFWLKIVRALRLQKDGDARLLDSRTLKQIRSERATAASRILSALKVHIDEEREKISTQLGPKSQWAHRMAFHVLEGRAALRDRQNTVIDGLSRQAIEKANAELERIAVRLSSLLPEEEIRAQGQVFSILRRSPSVWGCLEEESLESCFIRLTAPELALEPLRVRPPGAVQDSPERIVALPFLPWVEKYLGQVRAAADSIDSQN